MNIQETLKSKLGGELLASITAKAGIDPAQSGLLLDKSLAAILVRLFSKASTPDGAHAVTTIINRDDLPSDADAALEALNDPSRSYEENGRAMLGEVIVGNADQVATELAGGGFCTIGQASSFLAMLLPAVLGTLKGIDPKLGTVDGMMAMAQEQPANVAEVESVPRPGPVAASPLEAARAPEGMGWLGWFIPLVLIGGVFAYSVNQASCQGAGSSHPAAETAAAEAGSH